MSQASHSRKTTFHTAALPNVLPQDQDAIAQLQYDLQQLHIETSRMLREIEFR